MKLHLGCGGNILPGWLNIDGWPQKAPPGTFLKHDLGVGLPPNILDASVGCIFTEHFLEHLTREQAVVLLKDCYRKIKPGGVMRIVVPSLEFLVQKYLAKDTNWGGPGGWQPASPCIMINQGFRSWGHQFLYDKEELFTVLMEVGFADIRVVEWRKSSHPELNALEVRPEFGDLRVEAQRT